MANCQLSTVNCQLSTPSALILQPSSLFPQRSISSCSPDSLILFELASLKKHLLGLISLFTLHYSLFTSIISSEDNG